MKDHIFPLVSILLAGGILFTYVGPTWSGPIKETKAAIEINKDALVSAEEYADRQKALMSERSAIDPENLKKLSIFLPRSVDNVGLILDVNALAARSGVILTGIDVVGENPTAADEDASGSNLEDRIGSVNMDLSAIGSLNVFHTFLNGIEKSGRLLDVRDIKVTGSDTGVYTYQMTVRLYWLR